MVPFITASFFISPAFEFRIEGEAIMVSGPHVQKTGFVSGDSISCE